MNKSKNINKGYLDWINIDYKPVLNPIIPDKLIPFLRKEFNLLEIGCNKGDVLFFLAKYLHHTTGIDINAESLKKILSNLTKEESRTIQLINADFLKYDFNGLYDVLVLIRTLTCFPDEKDWDLVVNKSWDLIKEDGYIYIFDFMYFPESQNYRIRYQEGGKKGYRVGNFDVNDKNGNLLFIAHHHTYEEIKLIKKNYKEIFFQLSTSLSMNGNEVKVFEFIGQK